VPKVHHEACSQVQNVQDQGKKQAEYHRLTGEDKATIGKYASEHGVPSAVRGKLEKEAASETGKI